MNLENNLSITLKYHIVLKKCLVLLVTPLFFFINPCSGQVWPRVYHYDYHVYFENIREDYDKGYVICGNHLLNVNKIHFGLILKTDINGNKLWEKRYGNVESSTFFTHMERTSDGGAIFSGGTNDNDIMYDPLFLKVNACYSVEWCKIITSASYNYGTYVSALPDGSFVGMMRYYNINGEEIRISLIKLDATGEPVWITQLLQGDTTINNAEGYHLLVTSDTNFLVSGDTGGPSPLFVMADSAGEQQWELKWGEEESIWGAAYCTVEIGNGIFYSAGEGFCENGTPGPAIYKFDNTGKQVDDFCLLGDTISYGWALPICNYLNSSFLVGIEWENYPDGEGFCEVLIIDTVGNIITRRLLLNEERSPDDIITTFDDKILVGGNYVIADNWEIDLFKLNANLEDDTLNPIQLNYDTLCSYQIPSDTLSLDCEIFVNIDEIPSREEFESTIIIFPNPARDWISINFPELVSNEMTEIIVHDIFGRQVMNKRVVLENNMATIDISKLSPGLYTIICNNISKSNLKGKFVVVP
jgi:hypothetical protein